MIIIFSWLAENFSTIILSAVLILVVAAIMVFNIKNKIKGKSSCGYNCESCPMSGSCHEKI